MASNKSKDWHDSISEHDGVKLKKNSTKSQGTIADKIIQQSVEKLEAVQLVEADKRRRDSPCFNGSTFMQCTAPPPNLPATKLTTAKKRSPQDLDKDVGLVRATIANNKKVKKEIAKAEKRKYVLDLHSFMGDQMPKLSEGASSSSRYLGDCDVLDDHPELAELRKLILDAVTESILLGHNPLPLNDDLFASYAQIERFKRLFHLYNNSWQLFFKDTKFQVWEGVGVYFRKTSQEPWIPPYAIRKYSHNSSRPLDEDEHETSSFGGNYVNSKVDCHASNVVGSEFVDNYEKCEAAFNTTVTRLPPSANLTPKEPSMLTVATMPRSPDPHSPPSAGLRSFRTETTLPCVDGPSLTQDQHQVPPSYNSYAFIGRLPVVEPPYDHMSIGPPPGNWTPAATSTEDGRVGVVGGSTKTQRLYQKIRALAPGINDDKVNEKIMLYRGKVGQGQFTRTKMSVIAQEVAQLLRGFIVIKRQ